MRQFLRIPFFRYSFYRFRANEIIRYDRIKCASRKNFLCEAHNASARKIMTRLEKTSIVNYGHNYNVRLRTRQVIACLFS